MEKGKREKQWNMKNRYVDKCVEKWKSWKEGVEKYVDKFFVTETYALRVIM